MTAGRSNATRRSSSPATISRRNRATVLADFREQLPGVRDMERTLARLSVGSGNARDLVVLKESLAAVPKLKKALEGEPPGEPKTVVARQEPRPPDLLATLTSQITELPDLVDLISRSIADAPPLALKEG